MNPESSSWVPQKLRTPAFLAGAAWLFLSLFPTEAHAFCRTTTCDADVECSEDPVRCCELDEDGCDTNGIPVFWPTSFTDFSPHEGGLPEQDISAEEFSAVLDTAFEQWNSVECDGAPLSLLVYNSGLAECGANEFNKEPGQAGANVWFFSDNRLPGKNDALKMDLDPTSLAGATISYDIDTGEILDVDVEINGTEVNYTLPDEEPDYDLLSIMTHEAGHFLGLGHSRAFGATMSLAYDPRSIGPRSIEDDDIAGACTVYPPGREPTMAIPFIPHDKRCLADQTPSDDGGCSFTGKPSDNSHWALMALVMAGALWRGRRPTF